jgi:hypothetical protein
MEPLGWPGQNCTGIQQYRPYTFDWAFGDEMLRLEQESDSEMLRRCLYHLGYPAMWWRVQDSNLP